MWHKVMMVLVVYVLMGAALVLKRVDVDVSLKPENYLISPVYT